MFKIRDQTKKIYISKIYYLTSSYNHQSIILTNLLLKHDLIYYGNNSIHIFRLPKLTVNLLIKQTKYGETEEFCKLPKKFAEKVRDWQKTCFRKREKLKKTHMLIKIKIHPKVH